MELLALIVFLYHRRPLLYRDNRSALVFTWRIITSFLYVDKQNHLIKSCNNRPDVRDSSEQYNPDQVSSTDLLLYKYRPAPAVHILKIPHRILTDLEKNETWMVFLIALGSTSKKKLVASLWIIDQGNFCISFIEKKERRRERSWNEMLYSCVTAAMIIIESTITFPSCTRLLSILAPGIRPPGGWTMTGLSDPSLWPILFSITSRQEPYIYCTKEYPPLRFP